MFERYTTRHKKRNIGIKFIHRESASGIVWPFGLTQAVIENNKLNVSISRDRVTNHLCQNKTNRIFHTIWWAYHLKYFHFRTNWMLDKTRNFCLKIISVIPTAYFRKCSITKLPFPRSSCFMPSDYQKAQERMRTGKYSESEHNWELVNLWYSN